MKKLNRIRVASKIAEAEGQYEVVFVKKNGELRKMKCLQGVEHNLKGFPNKVVKEENSYLSTFDTVKKAYRTINLATMKTLIVNGEEYEVIS